MVTKSSRDESRFNAANEYDSTLMTSRMRRRWIKYAATSCGDYDSSRGHYSPRSFAALLIMRILMLPAIVCFLN